MASASAPLETTGTAPPVEAPVGEGSAESPAVAGLSTLGPLTTPEAAYAAYLDSEWMVSCYAYEISDVREKLTKFDEENAGKETDELCSRKERLAAELQELEACYKHYFSSLEEAGAARARLGPSQEELEAEARDAEEEYFDVTESCADW